MSATSKFVLTPDEARRYFASRLGKLPQRKEVPFKCPFHQDRTASGSANLNDGTWYCHTCNVGGGLLDFEKRISGKSSRECLESICAIIGRPNPNGHQAQAPSTPRIVATYDYTDRDGKLLYQAVRYQPKKFKQRRPDGKGGWIWNLDGITPVLYDLPGVLRANVVAIVEGEKDKHAFDTAAASFPDDGGVYVATTNAMGAGKWRDNYSTCLAGKKVLIIGDNDDAGRKHVQQVVASVSKHAQSVRVVELPDLPQHGDVSDYLQNHTPAELYALLQAVPADGKTAAPLTSELLLKCRIWIERFVVLGAAEATVLAFWILHTWAFDAAVTTPYMHVCSPEKESGKTTLLRVLKAVARFPRFSSSISASALGRVVGKDKPTLFLDELDATLKGDREKAQDIRGVLDSGFEIDGTYTRCVGKNFDVIDYPTFSPKVLAGIGELWDTVASRAIRIEIRRKLPSEPVEPFRQRRVKREAEPIAQLLQDWKSGAVKLLEPIEVADVPGLGDRQMDISEPLLQIAQLAGPEWTEALTKALQSIFGVARSEDGSQGVTLLVDIRDIFKARKQAPIPSRDLNVALNGIEGRPWAEWSHGKGLSMNNLAVLLKKYRIYPHVVDYNNEPSFRGYEAADFADAWKRYCPSPSPSPPV